MFRWCVVLVAGVTSPVCMLYPISLMFNALHMGPLPNNAGDSLTLKLVRNYLTGPVPNLALKTYRSDVWREKIPQNQVWIPHTRQPMADIWPQKPYYQIEPHLWLAAVFPPVCWWTLMKLRWKSYGNHPWRWRPTNAEPCYGHLWSIWRVLKSGGQRSHPKLVMFWQVVFHGKPRFSGTNFWETWKISIRWNLGNLPSGFWTS